MLQVIGLQRFNKFLFMMMVSCSFCVCQETANAQTINGTAQLPGADDTDFPDPMERFPGGASGQREKGKKKKAETVSGGGNDLTKGKTYKRYFINVDLPAPEIDPNDPRNGPTYRKFFMPVSGKLRRHRKKRRHYPHSLPEHFGVAGHRRRHVADIEESHNAQTVIGRQTLEHFVEGTNALEALALSTPGASFASSDAEGSDSVADTFYLRGYDEDELGVTMDGIPMGDQDFGGASGVDVSQILIQENIESLAASQGAGGLDTPSSQTLGGTLKYTSLDPSEKFGVNIDQQFGSFSGYRTFARLDSGRLNHTGTKFQASFLRNSNDLWTGGGFQRQEVVNFKLVQPVSNFGKITVTSDWSDSPEYNYAVNNPGMLRNLGYGDHNFYPNYGAANACAAWSMAAPGSPRPSGCHLPPGATQRDAGNLAYQDTQVERAYLEAIRGDFQLSPSIKSSTVVYGQVSDNRLGDVNPGLPSPGYGPGTVPGGNPYMNESDDHLKGRRFGVTQNFRFQLGRRNAIKTGIWYENSRYHEPTFMYGFGPNYAIPNDFSLKDADGFRAATDKFTTNTFQFYIEDGFQMARNMKFTYGFKSLVQTTNGGMVQRANDDALWNWGIGSPNGGPNGTPTYGYRPVYGRLTASNAFLPHFNYDWKFLPRHEFYFDVAENMRPFDAHGEAWSENLGNAASLQSGQAAFNEAKKKLRGERTWNYVVGYRYSGKPFSLGIDYYHSDYLNRLGMITQQQATIAAGPTISEAFVNLGKEKMDGMDLIGVAHLSNIFHIPDYMGKLDFMNSFSYNHAVYENDAVPFGGQTISITGAQQVYYPRYMYKTNVHYTNGRLGFDLNVNYNSARNITYTGDVKTPGYWTSELTGYVMLGRRGKESNAKLTFGISNLFGQHYVGGVYGDVGLKAPSAQQGGVDAMTPNLFWAAPREFFGALNIGF